MWKNFFNVALRNISKNRIFSLINIAGLAVGLASAIIIILFIAREISFDRFHENSENIYRLYVDGKIGDQTFKGAWTSYTMGPTFYEELDEVKDFVRLEVYPQQFIWRNDVKVVEDNVVFADSTFFDIFSIELLLGDIDEVLSKANSVVITKKKALQYFGNKNPIGETLEFNNPGNFYEVTGVMEEFPENAHFFCDFLLSMTNIAESRSQDWLSNSIYSYVLLEPGISYQKVEKKMNEVMLPRIHNQLKEVLDISLEEWNEGGNEFKVFLQPLHDIHLNPDIEYGNESCFRPVNDKTYIYIFSLIAFFILVIASINFMNLTTARSSIRAREIAMRKVAGTQKNTLILQFLTESVILSFLALLLALLLVEISLPWFNRSMNLTLDFESLGKGVILFGIIMLTLLVGLISGVYPSFYLSGYDALQGLRGGHKSVKRSALFRSFMVILQFTISVAIIVGTMIVVKQARYLLHKNPGFKDNYIVVLDRVYPLENKLAVFCDEVEKIPGVKVASNSSTYLGFSNLSSSFQIKGKDRNTSYMFEVNYVDPDFIETYGLELKTGRFFSNKKIDDTLTVVINETAVKEYGLKDPLNAYIMNPTSDGHMLEYRVIGVVKDFHHSSLRKEIAPYMFRYKTRTNTQAGSISIRFVEDNMYSGKDLKNVNQLWNKFTNNEPFQYFFLNDELHKYYREEERTGKISLLFSVLAITIACLGLLGLTLFNTERRMREIAIRKAMGADLWALLRIVSGEILLLLSISVILAWIIAFFFMKHWLAVFPYNIGFTPVLYLLAAIVAMFIALGTVNILTLRAAMRNPVDALYHE